MAQPGWPPELGRRSIRPRRPVRACRSELADPSLANRAWRSEPCDSELAMGFPVARRALRIAITKNCSLPGCPGWAGAPASRAIHTRLCRKRSSRAKRILGPAFRSVLV